MIGLKRGEVILHEHQKEWSENAKTIINNLKNVFGDTAIDIQHIGSTAIQHIKAKPMLDIDVAVNTFDDLPIVFPQLERMGIYKSTLQPLPGTILCAVKNHRESDICLSVIHIVLVDSLQWKNHINFRDYMNTFPPKAKEYEKLKINLAQQYPHDRNAYSNGKKEFIERMLLEAKEFSKATGKATGTVLFAFVEMKDSLKF